MSLLKNKLKESFKKDLSDESAPKKKGNQDDARILNYYDLPVGEKMKILFVPDENGELWKEWEVHGSNMKLRGAGTVRCCYESSGESCPACSISWEYYQAGNKKENQRWIKSKRTLAQCVVIDSPIELKDNPDENLVYFIYVPQKVKKAIQEAVMEDIVEDPTEHVFVLKKTENEGGYNNYESSHFRPEKFQPSQDLIDAQEEGLIRPYNFDEMEAEGDLIPKPTTSKDVQEWVDNVLSLENKLKNVSDSSNDGNDGDQPAPTSTSSKEEAPEQKASGDSSGMSVSEKLNRFRRGKQEQ